MTLLNIGEVYYRQGDQERTWEAYEQSLAIFRALGERQNVGKALLNISLLMKDQGNKTNAIQTAKEAVAILGQIEDAQLLADAEALAEELSGNISTENI